MKVLNFGSLNYDYVYTVDHIVTPGETTASAGMETFVGGKGLNQSIALARAGVAVHHAGMVGEDGEGLLQTLRQDGVDISCVESVGGRSGHTIIQVDRSGQNCILLYGGGNRCLTSAFIDQTLSKYGAGDLLLLQNEVNLLDEILHKAAARGMQIVLNPSPFDDALKSCDLSLVSVFLINEIEGALLSGETEPEAILSRCAALYPNATVVLTLGSDGVSALENGSVVHQATFSTNAVDTTAAGDTFTGFFLAARLAGKPLADCLAFASAAAAISVSRRGAAPSIPSRAEVEKIYSLK